MYQADFAHGNIGVADYYQRNGNYAGAEKFYLRALKKDSLANIARLNLAVTYNTEGKNNEAIQVLQLAVKTDPKNDRAWYNLALLYNEMKENEKATWRRSGLSPTHSQIAPANEVPMIAPAAVLAAARHHDDGNR